MSTGESNASWPAICASACRPARRNDPFDQLAVSVNRMLGEIEALIHEIAGVGNDIAHDLRTPLTRVRVRLERGRARATTLDELRTVVDQAIAGLDQSLADRSRHCCALPKSSIAAGSKDLARSSSPRWCARWAIFMSRSPRTSMSPFKSKLPMRRRCHGDRDLLFEAVANLVDNAVKFTPEGGRVELALLRRDGETV